MTGGRTVGLVCATASILFLTILVPGIDADRFTGGAQFYSVGPTALPYFAGGLVLLFSLLTLLPERGMAQQGEQGDSSQDRVRMAGRALLFILLAGAFSGGMLLIGFLPAAILFLLSIFALYRGVRWAVALPIALLVPIGVDLLLRKIFYIPLPTAPFL
jgi:hypothetical protein